MSQAERIGRIRSGLSEKGYIRVNDLRKTFEVSRITIMRDIAFMRDRLGTPLVYEPTSNIYRLHKMEDFEAAPQEFPGLWLTPHEAYAVLTLYNIASKFVPYFLKELLFPLRTPLKRMLGAKNFKMYRLDEKIDVDLPGLNGQPTVDLRPIYSALVECTQVSLTWKDKAGTEFNKIGLVTKLSLTVSGWAFHFMTDHLTPTSIPLLDVLKCVAVAQFNLPNRRGSID